MSLHPREPSELFEALGNHPLEAPIIVDFDETLWLRNSTEMFLDSVRPRFLAAILLQLLGALKPWRLFRHADHYRDWFRVATVLCFAPWSLWRWRRQALVLGPQYLNRPLLQALESRPFDNVTVVSFGFREILQPLLTTIAPRFSLADSCSLRSGAKMRIEGKAKAIERRLGAESLAQALSVTDSVIDADLLGGSQSGYLIQWPDAYYEQAGLKPLMPFVYHQRTKPGGEQHLLRTIIGHDLPVLLLAYAVISASPLQASASLVLYLLAFAISHEIGFYEKDKLGGKRASTPDVPFARAALADNFSSGFAWSLAIMLAGAASLLAFPALSWLPRELGLAGLPAFLGVWAAFLIFLAVMHLLFRWQNITGAEQRSLPLLGLQLGRVLGYAIVFQTSVAGALFCIGDGVAGWLSHASGGDRRGAHRYSIALALFLLLLAALAISGRTSPLSSWQVLLILGYSSFRAAKELVPARWKRSPRRA